MQSLVIRNSLPCLIVDGSYYTFYRYFATLRWFQFKHPNPIIEELHTNDAFITPLLKHVKDEMDTLCKRWKTTKDNIVFCRDCPRGSIWRHEHTTAYKGTRPINNKFNPAVFRNVYQFLSEENIPIIDIDTLEADDIAALTKDTLRGHGFSNEIIFITNDNDYLQLLDEKTHAYNLHEKDGSLRKRSTGNPAKDLRMKILMGDKSDNIPPVMPRLGAKTAEKLANLQEDELRRHLECKTVERAERDGGGSGGGGTRTAWEQYENNRHIIDLYWMMQHQRSKYDQVVNISIYD